MSQIKERGRTTIAFAVVFTLAAWFSLSNHCALGSVVSVSESASGSCPMHSAPAKKKLPIMLIAMFAAQINAIAASCVTRIA